MECHLSRPLAASRRLLCQRGARLCVCVNQYLGQVDELPDALHHGTVVPGVGLRVSGGHHGRQGPVGGGVVGCRVGEQALGGRGSTRGSVVEVQRGLEVRVVWGTHSRLRREVVSPRTAACSGLSKRECRTCVAGDGARELPLLDLIALRKEERPIRTPAARHARVKRLRGQCVPGSHF